MTSTGLTRPLEGLRVLDLSRVVSGPMCGRLLADLGADVIKVEPPGGDVTRVAPARVNGVSAYFAQVNAGKRNICVDLKVPEAAAVLARLAAGSDVVLENFRPGVLARYGLDAASLLATSPRLVYCSVTGWGQDGPWVDQRAYAPLVHASAGMIEMAGRVRGQPMQQEVNQHGDVYAAMLAANAILAALVQRGVTGRGQHLDVAMGEVLFYVNEWAAVELQDPAGDYGMFETWTHRVFPVADGDQVVILGNPTRWFPVALQALGGDPALLDDARFDSESSRGKHIDEVIAAVAALTARFDDASALLAVLPPQMMATPVRSVVDLARSDWADHRGLVADLGRGLEVPAAPWRSSGADVGTTGPVASLGEHNREVLADIGGYSDAEIAGLEAAGAVRGPGDG